MRSPSTARKFAPGASKESFKTGKKLLKIEVAVAERLAARKQELSSDPGLRPCRRQAAQERAAREVKERAGIARRSNGLRGNARRALRGTSRTRPGGRRPRLRRPTPRRASCASPTAQFVPLTTPRSPPRRRRASSF